MSTCRACGIAARKTVLALVLDHHLVKSGRVCQKCASGGMLIVSKKTPTVLVGPAPSKKTARALLAGVIATVEGQLKAARVTKPAFGNDTCAEDYSAGRLAAIEDMLATLKAVEA